MAGMNLTEKAGNKLWGIYHTDREYARILGDPLRTTVEAPTKTAAEEAAAKLGFSDPWAQSRSLDDMFRALERTDLVIVDCRAASTDVFLRYFAAIDVAAVLRALNARLASGDFDV